MNRLKKILKKIINKFKILVKERIPVFFQSNFGTNRVIKKLSSIGVYDVKKISVKQWHLGYRYYVGFYDGKKVFIKYNKNCNWIQHEIDIMKQIYTESNYLSKKIPRLYGFIVTEKYGLLVEDFITYKPIRYYIDTKSVVDNTKILKQVITIIKELQKISIMHADINCDNVYLSEENDVFLIDFGFSIQKDKYNFSYIGNQHKQDLILFNLNSINRLDCGYIDDAYSFLQVCKQLEPNLISNHYNEWCELNHLSNSLILDIRKM